MNNDKNDIPPPNVAAVTDDNGGNWRQSIAQSFRSEEVRSIAKVLASLEPGATSASKTMLAMKFEDSIFKAASDLDNYRMTIAKRIKKLQKHYAKQQQQQQDASGEGGIKSVESADQTREREILFESELREEYGSRLLYIVKHATLAIRSTREKQGEHKADILQQHVNNAKQWAVHLGLHLPVTTGGGATTLFVRQERRDMEFLNKLKGYLESRVDNIRSHIIKMADPDYFLEDALAKMDDTLLKETITEALRTTAATITNDDNVAGGGDEFEIECSIEQMQQFVERLNTPIPIPRRYQDGDVLKAAVARIEKFRAGAQSLYTYIMLPVLDKTKFRGTMSKCFSVVIECLNDLENDYNDLVKEEDGVDGSMIDKDGKRIIVLEDAWNNPMQFTELESGSDGEEETTPAIDMTISKDDVPPKTKRRKTNNNDAISSTTHEGSSSISSSSSTPIVIRSRYLLTPGRKPLSTLLPALQRKRAILVRSPSVTFVKLVFGTAFEMTIYFVPLLVAIRAIDHVRSSSSSSDDYNTVSTIGGHNWPSLYQGLQPRQLPLNTIDNMRSSSISNSSSLNVLGVTGSYQLLGPIVAKQLEYASCQATYVLRRCFTETTKGKYALATKKTENEIELLEAGALIRFLQIARATYSPDLVDVDL